MDRKYQIFISSTFEDLQDERRAVMEAILNLRHIPVGMELFHATDETQWSYIKRRIAECDYYIVILGARYGSEFEGKSYTRREYELAVELGIPVAAFLIHKDARSVLPGNKIQFEKQDKIEEFYQLCQQRLVKFWKTTDDLALKVSHSLNGLFEDNPQVGWVRGDSVPSPQVYDELAKLSEEKRALQKQVESLQVSSEVQIPPEVAWRIQKLDTETIESTALLGATGAPTSLLSAFLDLDHTLAVNSELDDIVQFFNDVIGYDIADFEVELCLARYVMHDLVEGNTRLVGKTRTQHYRLTPTGKEFLMYASVWKEQNKQDSLPQP